jgi:hypothetical protein
MHNDGDFALTSGAELTPMEPLSLRNMQPGKWTPASATPEELTKKIAKLEAELTGLSVFVLTYLDWVLLYYSVL